MVAKRTRFFTTEQVTALLGLGPENKWRVTKFVKSHEYGIKPSMGAGTGPGSRRLYDVENVCEIGLALRLLETGLRPKVIGQVLTIVRREGKLTARVGIEKEGAAAHYLAIDVSPEFGELLKSSRIRYARFFASFEEVEEAIKPKLFDPKLLCDFDVLIVGVGRMFQEINNRLKAIEKELSEVEP